ncbi:Neurobeachin-like protein 1 [Holothuria leucospilota]|uniref:Neurobeachin-like protein 1 n=1 Tax=Holothuria leucospilota TaxID=206669 RepID=A0A9Q1BCW5_HOLLE|nr:Neurobeachin-like protein 1 [Holothuria leucospilota]
MSQEDEIRDSLALYAATNDFSHFKDFVTSFVEKYGALVDVECQHVQNGLVLTGPDLTALPSNLLEVFLKEFETAELTFIEKLNHPEGFSHLTDLLKILIILCRKYENIALIASCEYLRHIVPLTDFAIKEVCSTDDGLSKTSRQFFEHALFFVECMYDPSHLWRRQSKNLPLPKDHLRQRQAILSQEIVPFFYDCLQESKWELLVRSNLHISVIHMLGAILVGSKENAMLMSTPPTIDSVISVLSSEPPEGTSAECYAQAKELLLHCFDHLIKICHIMRQDQRQVSLLDMLKRLMMLLGDFVSDPAFQAAILKIIPDTLRLETIFSLQSRYLDAGLLRTMVRVLQKNVDNEDKSHDIPYICVCVLSAVLLGNSKTKVLFKDKVGYQSFGRLLKRQGTPSNNTISALFDMVCIFFYEYVLVYEQYLENFKIEVVESPFTMDVPSFVLNTGPLIVLLKLLPVIEDHEKQREIIDAVSHISVCYEYNRMLCCSEGVIGVLLDCLDKQECLSADVQEKIIRLIENLGSYSILSSQVKHMIGLMRGPDDETLSPLCSRLMHALSTIARKETRRGAYHYFDFQEDDTGIHIPTIRKWPGNGFTFHTWVCLNSTPLSAKTLNKGRFRRQLYSFYTSTDVGFEAFFTMEGVLVVGISHKKEFSSTALTENPVLDNGWHSITITHISTRRLFGHSQVQIYIDGMLRHTTPLRFPSVAEPFSSCSISCPRDEDKINKDVESPSRDGFRGFPIPHSISLPIIKSPKNQSDASSCTTIPVDMKDMEWGSPRSLQGQMGSACVFSDSIQPIQVKKLHAAGPNERCNFQSEDTDLTELKNKLLLFYHANACTEKTCADLSQRVYEGQLCGTYCGAYDLKDVINCIGGVQVLFPILELVTLQASDDYEPEDTIDAESPVDPGTPDSLEDWEVLPRTDRTDLKLEKNKVAGFLNLLKNICVGHNINQELLHTTQGISTVAALLQKVNPKLIDVKVLMAIQMFFESVCIGNESLIKSAYRHLLFDFRLWSTSDFPVRIGHIQFLSNIIKDNRKKLRKLYGVQYLLDVIRTYYSSKSCNLLESDAKIIRHSLFGLIKYFLRGITASEMRSVIAFVLSVDEDTLICEALDLILYLLETPGKDQSYLLLLEENAELLYSLVTQNKYSDTLLIRVFKITSYLIRTKVVSARHKVHIKLVKIGYGGLTMQMDEDQINMPIAQYFLEQVTEGSVNYQGLLSILQLLPMRSCPLKLQVCTTVLDLLYRDQTAIPKMGKLPGWQDVIVRLLIKTSLSESPVRRNKSYLKDSPQFNEIEESIDDEVDGANGDEDSDVNCPSDLSQDPEKMSKASDNDTDVFDNEDSSTDFSVESPPHVRVVLEGNVPSAKNSQQFVDTVINILVQLMWTGVQGSDEDSWIARAEVFKALSEISLSHELFEPVNKIKRLIFEKLLDSCIMLIKDGQRSSVAEEMCLWLMRLVHDFLFKETGMDPHSWSSELVMRIFEIFEGLKVWENQDECEWKEMSHIGLRLVLRFAGHHDTEICSLSSAKLHYLLKIREITSPHEACFLLGSLDDAMVKSFSDSRHTYAHLLPILRAMVETFNEQLSMDKHLPNMPSNSKELFEEIENYCQGQEWRMYVDKQVVPFMQAYITDNYAELSAKMAKFWRKCFDVLNKSIHKREKDRGESKLRFQSQILEPAQEIQRTELARHGNFVNQLSNQRQSTLRQWRASKRFLVGERGAWAEKNAQQIYWKLSSQENFSRMRLKLAQNYSFDPHTEASNERDNIRTPINEQEEGPALPTLGQEARVKELKDVDEEEWTNPDTVGEEQPASSKEKMVVSEECDLITLVDIIQGRLEVTTTHVYFYDSSADLDEGSGQDFKWSLSHLREVHLRRYNLRKSAIEIFFINQTNYFINFKDSKVRDKTYQQILSLRPPNLYYFSTKSPANLLKASGLTQKWVNREISNFEYLMQLNTIAGRTYNDLSQYPVFPWILCDFHSDVLDLENPDVFRDLSKPIGVLNPKHVEEVKTKYESFEDPSGATPKFHYGTHYSNPAGVMHYMVRMEPFTTLHIMLQCNKFDHADRQFHSIASLWDNLWEGNHDVKELIPEFFYLPEFLVNDNNFDLGKLQCSGEKVDDVILPKWAKSPEDFIYKHRQALESEYVSAHLHEWIDLIFGYKQKGEEAEKVYNVFYYTSYEGAVDLEKIANEEDRKRTEQMINNFGQTPCQLLKEPHPKRKAIDEKKRGVQFDNIFNFLGKGGLKAFFVEVAQSSCAETLVYVRVPKSQTRFPFYQGMHDTLVSISEQGIVGCHGWLPYDKSISNYFTFDRDSTLFSSKTRKCVGGPFAPGIKVTSSLFVATHDAKLLFTGGHWDSSLRVMNMRGKMIAHMARHQDVVTCLALDNCGMYLITGSRDTTCMIWEVMYQNGVSSGISNRPSQTLYGHDDEVTSVAISSELDMAVSGSKDGTVIVHTLLKGHYIRTLNPPNEKGLSITIPALAISDEGHIIIHCRQLGRRANEESGSIHVYSINGKYQCSDLTVGNVNGLEVVDEYLITGDDRGILTIRKVFDLEVRTTLPLEVPIHSLSVVPTKSHILVGLRDGKLIIVGVNKSAEIKKFLSIVTSR